MTTALPGFSASRAFRAGMLLLWFLLVATPAFAKRSAPKPVPPVTAGSIEYSAPRELMGFVVATDIARRKELWRERIYTVHINPALERDVQEVFITSLAVERGTLLIANERGESFAVDLATRRVTKGR